MKIALGTAQFGLTYGVANTRGQVVLDEAYKILTYALSSGIDTIDTAIAYGESEQRLGEIGIDGWKVVSKLPAIPEQAADVASWVFESVRGSLHRLKVSKLYGLLLHRSQELLCPQGNDLYLALKALKREGLVEKIGVSVYGPEELDALWPHFEFDLVQAPYNIIDRRIVSTGWLMRLHQKGIEVHTRSAFLQGLLLMSPEERPVVFSRWHSLFSQWDAWVAKQSVSQLQACLGFAFSQPGISRVVVGVDSLRHLQEILSCSSGVSSTPPDGILSNDEDLINPSRWGSL